jgi:hypothetical protein
MQFKTLALATTSLVVLGFAMAPAANAKAGGMMGRVDIDFSYWWDDWNYGGECNYDDEYTTFVGKAFVNIPYDEWTNLQLDVDGETSLDEDGYEQAGHFGGGAHLNWRDPMVGLLGAFVGFGTLENYYGRTPTWMAGFEGQYYCERWTFYGQAGWWDSDDEGYALQNAGFLRAVVSYYASQQLKVSGGLKYIAGDIYDGYADSDGWDWIVRADYWFGKSIPVAAFAEFNSRYSDIDYVDSELDTYRLNVGVTFYFGGDGNNDIMYHDRNGASVNLPDFDEIRVNAPL